MFAVFGITMDYCIKQARKKVKAFDRITSTGELKAKSLVDFESEVEATALKAFERAKKGCNKGVKLSADFSQPKVAREFLELAKKNNGVNLSIYQKQPKLTDKGTPVLNSKKQPVMSYQPIRY